MCGIVGFLNSDGIADEASSRQLIGHMRDHLLHRGPDDDGAWLDCAGGLALGFRRLSILDLSPAGHQPMLSGDGRYVIVMNGEVYNFAAIRTEIETVRGPLPWRGHCDTEVLLEAIALWGVQAALCRVNGMFALAVWDRHDRVLWLARDRIGKKPLYYGWAGESFIFGSELKALRPHPRFDARVSPDALSEFLQLGYVLGPHSIFSAISKLPGGHLLRLDRRAAARCETPAPSAYWSLRDVALAGLDAQASGRPACEEELEETIRDAVACRMVADVPVGAFLSGGIDSSLVTAMMAAGSSAQVRSFAIGFPVERWNEAPHARVVAEHLGTQHEELCISPAEFIAVVRDLPSICDEPIADNSLAPTTLLSRMARRSVTVALSGDGGDELFCGYQRYDTVDRWIAHRAALPGPARWLASGLIKHLGVAMARRRGSRQLERRLSLLSSLLGDGDPERFSELVMSQSLDVDGLLATSGATRHPLTSGAYTLGRSTPIDQMTFMDTASYLTDDILAKVDRASMSASLEVRCPLLDHRVIEMSWRFPTAAKCRDGTGKLPLREILYRRVPRAIVDRPKMGFSAPVQVWLLHELRDWAEALMSREALARHGLLNVDACRRLWEDFAQHGRGWDGMIWNLLTFQAWHASMTAELGKRAPSPKAGSAMAFPGACS